MQPRLVGSGYPFGLLYNLKRQSGLEDLEYGNSWLPGPLTLGPKVSKFLRRSLRSWFPFAPSYNFRGLFKR